MRPPKKPRFHASRQDQKERTRAHLTKRTGVGSLKDRRPVRRGTVPGQPAGTLDYQAFFAQFIADVLDVAEHRQ